MALIVILPMLTSDVGGEDIPAGPIAVMSIDQLEGRKTSRGPLRLAEVRPGRFPEERDAVLKIEGEGSVGRLKHFAGRRSAGVPPWIEAGLVRDDEGFLGELVEALASVLPAGGRLMVLYGDDETERGLKRRFPPVVTPIGHALFRAGATWFKDWYYPEGWLEGEFKLQGNKPVSDESRREQLAGLRERVEAWLPEASDDDVAVRARERAWAVLELVRA
jgi:hypothetical protein